MRLGQTRSLTLAGKTAILLSETPTMAIITPTLIDNRLGVVASVPAATTNNIPGTGGRNDIGADAGAQTPNSVCAIFDVTLTSGGIGDTATFTIPASIAKFSNPSMQETAEASASAPEGLDITVTPKNATGITGAPFVAQAAGTPGTIVLTFAAAAAGAIYRVKIDGRYSAAR